MTQSRKCARVAFVFLERGVLLLGTETLIRRGKGRSSPRQIGMTGMKWDGGRGEGGWGSQGVQIGRHLRLQRIARISTEETAKEPESDETVPFKVLITPIKVKGSE